jgi:hypothetical protein
MPVSVSVTTIRAWVATAANASCAVCQATPTPAATRDTGTNQSPIRCPITILACVETPIRGPATDPVSAKPSCPQSVLSHQNRDLRQLTRIGTRVTSPA